MIRRVNTGVLLTATLAMFVGTEAHAQYGYPVGYGAYGWGGWGGGGSTVQGSIASGMGAYAAGAGYYNRETAIAASINTDTVMRWNQYMYQSQLEANKRQRQRQAQRQYGNEQAHDQIYRRLRDNPDARDIYRGDALNVAVDEITDPRIYAKAISGMSMPVGGDSIRNIPFQYAPGAITTSIHQLTQGPPPQVLMTDAFADDRAAFKGLGREIRKDLEDGEKPNPETITKALAVINAAEAKADKILPKNTRDRTEADKYLKSLHGLLVMLQTPALDLILAGVEKRPDATIGELLTFMRTFNLRFGPATTSQQKQIYDALYPKLVALRKEVAPILASAGAAPTMTSAEAGEFFSGMSYKDLQKKAPPPPAPAGGTK